MGPRLAQALHCQTGQSAPRGLQNACSLLPARALPGRRRCHVAPAGRKLGLAAINRHPRQPGKMLGPQNQRFSFAQFAMQFKQQFGYALA